MAAAGLSTSIRALRSLIFRAFRALSLGGGGGFAWPPSAAAVSLHGPKLAALVGSPVILAILIDILRKEVVDTSELEWKRREVTRAAVKLREVVKGEHTKYQLQTLGAGGAGTVRLSFLLNVGGYSQAALQRELSSLFEAPSERIVLVEEVTAGAGFVDDEAALERTRSAASVLQQTTERLRAALSAKGTKIGALFAMFSSDGDPGFITQEEFRLGLAQCEVEVGDAELHKLIRAISRDSSGSGKISLPDWTAAFGPRQVTVALLPPPRAPSTDSAEHQQLGGAGGGDGQTSDELVKGSDELVKDDFDADLIARKLKKKLTELTEQEGGNADASYPLLRTVETDIVPIQLECNEIKWTEAKRIHRWRQEANHMRFRPIEIREEARFLAEKEAAVMAGADAAGGGGGTEEGGRGGGGTLLTTLIERKTTMLVSEQESIGALLREAAELTWRTLRREVSESVAKMQEQGHHEHEKFRDGAPGVSIYDAASILTEIDVCHSCSCPEILRAGTPGQGVRRGSCCV
jgi:hypothetical protein